MTDGPRYPTIAEIISQLRQDPSLPGRRGQTLISDLRRFAAAADLTPQSFVLDPVFVRERILALSEWRLRVTGKRIANIRCNVRWCMRRYVTAEELWDTALSPEWDALFETASLDKWRDIQISRFARYCSATKVPPEAVCEPIIRRFQALLKTDLKIADTDRHIYTLVRSWNQAVATSPGWPQHRIRLQRHNDVVVPWDFLSGAFTADVTAWLSSQAGQDLLDPRSPSRSLRPTTVKNHRYLLRAMASALLHRGFTPASIGSLAALFDNKTEILRYFLERAGNRPSNMLERVAALLIALGRHWLHRPSCELDELRAIKRRITPVSHGMTAKNRARLFQFEDERNKALLLSLPQKLMRDALSLQGREKAAARLAQMAVATELLLTTLVRIRNLNLIEIDRHFVTRGSRPGTPSLLVFDRSEVKNELDLEFEIGPECRRLLGLYLSKFHPALGGGPYLFPGKWPRRPKQCNTLYSNIQKAVASNTGLYVNPHLFRHIGAKLFLDEHPGHYEVVRRTLGHKKLETTLRFYAGMEAAAAAKQFDQHVIGLRQRSKSSQG